MGDAFKCKNCGTVVETLQSCPSCGERAMQPIQSSGDTDVVADIAQSGTAAEDAGDGSSNGTDTDDASKTTATEADITSRGDATETDPAGSGDSETPSGRTRERAGRNSRSESGLLSWLKSLF